jgi:hypothetical protein
MHAPSNSFPEPPLSAGQELAAISQEQSLDTSLEAAAPAGYSGDFPELDIHL